MNVNILLLKRIHEGILTGATGSPVNFAKKLDISRSQLLKMMKFFREELDAPIDYSRPKSSYYYTEDCDFYFGIVRSRKDTLRQDIIDAISKAANDVINRTIIFLWLVLNIPY